MTAPEYIDRFVEANGIRLHVVDWGGDGPPAIFLNPTGFHAHVWDTYIRHLRGSLRCLALDTRGHGDSDKPGVYGWTDFAGDFEGVLDVLGLKDVTGIGHSAGATSIAVVAARRHDLFTRAVFIDPILFFGEHHLPSPADSPMSAAARRRRSVFPSREAMFERFADRSPFSTWDRGALDLYVRYAVRDREDGSVELKCSGDDEAEMYRWGPRPLPSEEFLPRIACPVLLITGEKSDAMPPNRAQTAGALIRSCTRVTVPGASHFVPFERPALVQDAIDRFLRGPAEQEERGNRGELSEQDARP